METTERTPLIRQPVLWLATSVVALVVAHLLARYAGQLNALGTASEYRLSLLAYFGLVVIAGLATWRLATLRSFQLLLPVSAVALLLLDPGAQWRLEWAVLGVPWTIVAVLVFLRLVRETDELERRTQFEGTAAALAAGVIGGTTWALFEPWLPSLRPHWVTAALLLAWWLGWARAARRYR